MLVVREVSRVTLKPSTRHPSPCNPLHAYPPPKVVANSVLVHEVVVLES